MKENIDHVGENISVANASWSFGGDVPKTFEEHVSRSVPLYNEGHDLVCRVSDFFIKDDSIAYELGCSTGLLSKRIARHCESKSAHFIGIDVEDSMIRYASDHNNAKNVEFICDDIVDYTYEKSDFIIAYYTVQFIRPSRRQILIDKVYECLNWGGALLLFEKVRAKDARFQDMMTALYTDFKIEQGYGSEEIIGKTRSLKGVLEPFSTQGNLDMLKRAGFVDIMSVMKYVSFEGFLAIK